MSASVTVIGFSSCLGLLHRPSSKNCFSPMWIVSDWFHMLCDPVVIPRESSLLCRHQERSYRKTSLPHALLIVMIGLAPSSAKHGDLRYDFSPVDTKFASHGFFPGMGETCEPYSHRLIDNLPYPVQVGGSSRYWFIGRRMLCLWMRSIRTRAYPYCHSFCFFIKSPSASILFRTDSVSVYVPYDPYVRALRPSRSSLPMALRLLIGIPHLVGLPTIQLIVAFLSSIWTRPTVPPTSSSCNPFWPPFTMNTSWFFRCSPCST